MKIYSKLKCFFVKNDLINQILLGFLPFFLFVLVSLIYNNQHINFQSIFAGRLCVFGIVYFVVLIASVIYKIKKIDIEAIKKWLYNNIMIIIVLFIIFASHMPFITSMQRWDAGEYYFRLGVALDNFTYSSIGELFECFSLCGHSASVFCIIYLIGEMIFPGKIIGVSLVSITITLIAMYCLYKIFQKIFSNTSNTRCALYILLISFTPLTYTYMTHLNLDYAMAMFVLMIIYCYMYDKWLLAGLLSVLCFQIKENALVIIAGIAIGEMIRCILIKENVLKNIFMNFKLYVTLIAALIQLRYFKIIGNNWTATAEQEAGGLFKWDNNGTECLGFNKSYIIMKLKQQFILNFNWIVAIIVILGIILYIYNVKKKKNAIKNNSFGQYKYPLSIIICAFVSNSLFAYLYITNTCTRYNIIGDILLYIIAIYFINNFYSKYVMTVGKKIIICIFNIMYCVWLCILITECFITIDPISKLCFTKIDAINMDSLLMMELTESASYGESLIHNTQYHCYDIAMDNMLKCIDFNPETTDIILNDEGGVFICGNLPMYYLNWDTKKKKRVFYSNEDTIKMDDYYSISLLKIKQQSDELIIEDEDQLRMVNKKLKNKAVFVVCTYFLDRGLDIDGYLNFLKQYYNVSDRKISYTFQGGIYYYEMELKNSI